MTNSVPEMITKEQADIAFKFLNALFSEDVEGYWNTISQVDQARVYGQYLVATELKYTEDSFRQFVHNNYQLKQREIYKEVKEKAGIATHIRYTDEGEITLYFLEDVQVPRVYIAETEVKGYPLVIALDTDIVNGEYKVEWKVRIYKDQHYKSLN